MLDALPFEKIWQSLHGNSIASKGIIAFIHFLEKRLGGRFVYDAARIPFGNQELPDLLDLAEKFRAASIIKSYRPTPGFCDEPPIFSWIAEFASSRTKENFSGGASAHDERQALTATLAEALERYLWLETTDYFVSPQRATTHEISKSGQAILPERFAGFSPEQRTKNSRLTLAPDAEYLWVRGYSWTAGKNIWIPAQVVSGKHGGKNFSNKDSEPVIVAAITTGLATGPTLEFALLNGALEIIERDALMITWLNQLSPPRIDLDAVQKGSASLAALLESCKRYRLGVEALRMPTDAPAYAVCAVVRDESDAGPPIEAGLRANRSLPHAIEGALLEALRMRRNARHRPQWDKQKKKENIYHTERVSYWNSRERAPLLDFLTQGPVSPHAPEEWETDTLEKHLERIIRWCAEKGYELASVPLTHSKRNASPWHTEMVVMPDLIPFHMDERYPYTFGNRLQSIPKKFGYTPRAKPFLSEPHPFA